MSMLDEANLKPLFQHANVRTHIIFTSQKSTSPLCKTQKYSLGLQIIPTSIIKFPFRTIFNLGDLHHFHF